MTRVLILARGFSPGGAERQLLTFIHNVSSHGLAITIGYFRQEIWHDYAIRCPNVTFVDLQRGGEAGLFRQLIGVLHLAKAFRPAVIYGYGGIGTWLLSLFIARMQGTKVVWGIRNADPSTLDLNWLSKFRRQCSIVFSWLADGYLANSHAGAQEYIIKGFRASRMSVIENGIDSKAFVKDRSTRLSLRRSWGVPDEKRLIGLVARLDPRKSHTTFLRAAALLVERRSDVHFVCIGGGTGKYADFVMRESADLIHQGHLTYLGHQDNMAVIYNALDINVLCSITEGFPNSLCEAMACEIPSIATDAGDCAEILSGVGSVVSRGDARGLFVKLDELLDQDLQAHGIAAREKIVRHYSVQAMVNRTTAFFQLFADSAK